MKHLILGGVKSGKSRYAETCATKIDPDHPEGVCVIVTAQAQDDEMAERIKRHQADRHDQWKLIEAPLDLAKAIDDAQRDNEIHCIIIDCLTLWVTNLLMIDERLELDDQSTLDDQSKFGSALCAFELSLQSANKDIFIVSNETNMGVTPMGELSRSYCDTIGLLHQRLAQQCEQVSLVVAGLPLKLKG